MAGLLWYRSYMDSLANTSGYYPDIHAGHADRVTELTLDAPYLVRETPSGYNQLELMELVGGSVAWNQLLKEVNSTNYRYNYSTDTVSYSDGVATFTAGQQYGGFRTNFPTSITKDHIYVVSFSAKAGSSAYQIRYNFAVSGSAITAYLNLGTDFEQVAFINKCGANGSGYLAFQDTHASDWSQVQVKEPQFIDLTLMLGSTLADYVCSLEQSQAGSAIQWLKDYDLIDDQYHAYSAPTMQSVEATAHVTKDANNTTIATYPLDSDLVLRGIPKLSNGRLYYDGDTYEWDGTVTRKYGKRAYQAGDESLTDAITDGTNTVYKLQTPTTESADPYTAEQDIEEGGTEEFVTGNSVPVGNVSVYRRV